MKRFQELLMKDLGWKLLSVAIATTMWFMVISINQPIDTRSYSIRLGNKLLLILMVFLGIRVTEIIFRPLIAHIIRHIAAICLLSGTRFIEIL